MKSSRKVLVAHPGLQHSHQLAWGLNDSGYLRLFRSGVPIRQNGESVPFWLPKAFHSRVKVAEIPPQNRENPFIWLAFQKIVSKQKSAAFAHDAMHRVFHYFDWCTARRVLAIRPSAVVAYENSAYYTFLAAKKIGAKCVLDAPSLHHKAASMLVDIPTNGYLSTVNQRKDEEIRLADLILTCSTLAKNSYVDAGVDPTKIVPILLGAELPDQIKIPTRLFSNVPRFVFAGTMMQRKSTDLIFGAFRRIYQEGIRANLIMVGGFDNTTWLDQLHTVGNATYQPGVGQNELFGYFATSDCLLLPSRFDSFGMVVAEGMAVGLPAIVSTKTGAREIVDRFPGSGWVIEPTEEAIYSAVKDKILNREKLRVASDVALKASQQFTWRTYRANVSALIKDLLEN